MVKDLHSFGYDTSRVYVETPITETDRKIDEVFAEILEDRKNIEQQYGTLARGMAYPFGAYNENVLDVLKNIGIAYSEWYWP